MKNFQFSKNFDYNEIEPIYNRPKLKFGTILLCIGIFVITGTIIILYFGNGRPNSRSNSIFMQGAVNETESDLIVSIEQGQIRGMNFTSRLGRNYYGFLGVPFAKPPVGNLRFSPPKNPEAWNGTRDCRSFQPQCMQLHIDKLTRKGVPVGSEDCLYANIFTPQLPSKNGANSLPVMIYVHGGIENGNGSMYGADYMMDENLVLVFVHFRIHVLANLNTGDEVARGNFGIKDIVKALQWVQANIKSFGGDPTKVTLFGNSSGAMWISILLFAPMSKGLFHRTIHQSGTILFHGKYTRDPKTPLLELAKEVNCPTNTSSMELLNCLRKIDASLLTELSGDIAFMNSVEAESTTPELDTCLEDEPLNLVKSGKFHSVDSIYGVNSAENGILSLGLLFSQNITDYLNENWDEVMGDLLDLDNASNPSNITAVLKDFYIGSGNVSRANLKNLTDLLSDRDWVHPTKVEAEYQLKAQNRDNSVYLYYLTEKAPKSYCKPELLDSWGDTGEFEPPCHADEVQFLFPSKKVPFIDSKSSSFNFSRIMINIWVNFADSGVPHCSLPEFNLNPWTKVESDDYATDPYLWYNLTEIPSMTDPVSERMKLWDKFSLTDLYAI